MKIQNLKIKKNSPFMIWYNLVLLNCFFPFLEVCPLSNTATWRESNFLSINVMHCCKFLSLFASIWYAKTAPWKYNEKSKMSNEFFQIEEIFLEKRIKTYQCCLQLQIAQDFVLNHLENFQWFNWQRISTSFR